jgi:hypothetical protein
MYGGTYVKITSVNNIWAIYGVSYITHEYIKAYEIIFLYFVKKKASPHGGENMEKPHYSWGLSG